MPQSGVALFLELVNIHQLHLEFGLPWSVMRRQSTEEISLQRGNRTIVMAALPILSK